MENKNFSNEELKEELRNWTIYPMNNNYASSTEILYETYRTTIVAKAFHIPNPTTKEIHHFTISIRTFTRKTKKEKWVENIPALIENESRIDQVFKLDNSDAILELTKFLNGQFEVIGKTISNKSVLIENPNNIDIPTLMAQMALPKKIELGTAIRLDILKSNLEFLKSNLDKNETFIQDWLDEDEGKY